MQGQSTANPGPPSTTSGFFYCATTGCGVIIGDQARPVRHPRRCSKCRGEHRALTGRLEASAFFALEQARVERLLAALEDREDEDMATLRRALNLYASELARTRYPHSVGPR